MKAPGIATRIVCAVVGAVVAPLAVGLISTGGEAWARAQMQYGYSGAGLPLDRLAGPALLMLIGLVLLIGVVLTGMLSASGLIAAGVVGIVPLIGTIAPGTALALVRARVVPAEFLSQLYAGLPVAILPLLGFMGLVLVTVRRVPPRAGLASGVLGAVAALVALALGGGLLMWGVHLGIGRAFMTFDTEVQPLPALLVLVAIILIGVGTMASRWSPLALALPAVILLVLSVMNMTSAALYRLPLRDIVQPTTMFLFYGGGIAVATAQLAFTAVLLVLRRRIRRLSALPVPGTGSAPGAVLAPGPIGTPGITGGRGAAGNVVPGTSPSTPGQIDPATPDASRPAPGSFFPPAPPAPPAG